MLRGRRACSRSLSLGVNIGEADFDVLRHVGHKAPAQKIQTAFASLAIVPDHGQQISRRGIPTRREIGRGPMRRDREDELDLAYIGGEADAATHDAKVAELWR